MRTLIFIILFLKIFVTSVAHAEFAGKLPCSDLIVRDDRYYQKFSDEPLSGEVEPTGDVPCRMTLVDGVPIGKYEEYNKFGQLFVRGTFSSTGDMEGLWQFFDNNGELQAEFTFNAASKMASNIKKFKSGELTERADLLYNDIYMVMFYRNEQVKERRITKMDGGLLSKQFPIFDKIGNTFWVTAENTDLAKSDLNGIYQLFDEQNKEVGLVLIKNGSKKEIVIHGEEKAKINISQAVKEIIAQALKDMPVRHFPPANLNVKFDFDGNMESYQPIGVIKNKINLTSINCSLKPRSCWHNARLSISILKPFFPLNFPFHQYSDWKEIEFNFNEE